MTALSAFLIAFVFSYLGTLGLLKTRVARGFIDVPNERSSHEAPKPRIGGVAIVIPFYVAMAYLAATVPATRSFYPLVIGSALLFLTGLVDDWRGLGVKIRFGMQLAVAVGVASTGVVLDHLYIPAVGDVALGWFSIPLTCLFIMASINFYNFIDGIDGLAAGSAFLAAGFLALIAGVLGHAPLALVLLAVSASSVGFLQFNFPPSRLFMGDSGSTFLGFFFAYAAIAGNRLTPELPVFIPILILSSLYLDAGLTLFNRIIRRENIFQAHHTHYYQRLLSLGLNHKQVTLLEYALVVLLGVSALVYFKAGGLFPVFFSGCWLVLFTLLILKIRGLERGDRMFWEKRTLLVIATDLVLITVAYLGAYFLRMNFRFTQPEGTAVLRALPIVLVVRSACFLKYGLYRSVWKYTSTADIVRIVKAVTLGSAIILTAVVLLYRFVAFPRTLFIIEYLLLTVLVLGSRFAFRLFHEIGKEAHGVNARRYAIVGAGDRGERVARELRNDESRSIAIVCFIDDDPGKIGLTLQGVPITGPIEQLEEVCREHRVDVIVLGAARMGERRTREVLSRAEKIGVVVERGRSLGGEPPGSPGERMEQVTRALGRRGFDASPSARVFFRGKRVLLTNAGGPIGSALARQLVALGSKVTVQVPTAAGARGLEEAPRGSVVVDLCVMKTSEDANELIERSYPDVVFHCVSLDVDGEANLEGFLWDTAVRETAMLANASSNSTVSSFVLLSFWPGTVAEGPGVKPGAVAEAVVLNHSGLAAAEPKAVRFPRIFGTDSLRDITGGIGAVSTRVFELLEGEAVGLALECAAAEPGISLLVPRVERAFDTEDIRKIVAGGRGVSPATRLAGQSDVVVFPAERRSPAATGGADRVDGPVYPADEHLGKVLSTAFLSARGEERSEWLQMATNGLYGVHPSGVGPIER